MCESVKYKQFFSFLILGTSLFFYCFFAFYDGVVLAPDSSTYIYMSVEREPLYPMFLAVFRKLFSNFTADFYLSVVIFVQSILAAISVWSVTIYLHYRMHLKKVTSICILCILLSIALFWRIIIGGDSIYSNCILSEGLAISCYILFLRFLFEYIECRAKRILGICCFLSFILISMRKQMIISGIMLFICILCVSFCQKRYWKGFILAFCSLIMVLLGNILLDLGYNYTVRGEMIRHFGDIRFVSTMVFYTADRNDSQWIENEEVEGLFLKIYDCCDENGYLKKSAGKGWENRISHFINSYDQIQLYTMKPIVREYVGKQNQCNEIELNRKVDDIMKVINLSVIPENMTRLLRVFLDNVMLGFIMTAAHWKHPVLRMYCLFVYVAYVLLLLYHIRKRNEKVCFIALVTLVSIVLNIILVSMVIFCQTRYMIYNTALFYISFLLMIDTFLRGRTRFDERK